jgi:hypothetical protein
MTALDNYKLELEHLEDEKKIWRTPKNQTNTFKALRPELFRRQIFGLLRSWRANRETNSSVKGD